MIPILWGKDVDRDACKFFLSEDTPLCTGRQEGSNLLFCKKNTRQPFVVLQDKGRNHGYFIL